MQHNSALSSTSLRHPCFLRFGVVSGEHCHFGTNGWPPSWHHHQCIRHGVAEATRGPGTETPAKASRAHVLQLYMPRFVGQLLGQVPLVLQGNCLLGGSPLAKGEPWEQPAHGLGVVATTRTWRVPSRTWRCLKGDREILPEAR